ncbi:5-formyltetrahydrofolate cyclo-ligase [Bacillus sp. FJAT-27225]|nr:5-formyltetrahydrofolate cyclo-ligase [Bacillus sp. FJAT-27225]
MMQELKSISEDEYSRLSGMVAESLYKQPDWRMASTIGITVSRPPEVDTYQIIKQAWSDGKKIAVPKCLPETREMEFRYITDFKQLESVYYGLFEPIREKTDLAEPGKIGLLIVPGLAFTLDGFRMGFGGGYYDRFLSGFHGKTLSLAFEKQIVDYLPLEPHDMPVSKIITDKRVISK